MKHKCPKDGCEVMCPQSKLACPAHWRLVPQHLQGRLLAAWRKFTADPEAYLAIRKRCVDAINGVS